ncbi:MAG TPA: hypothetical protein VKY57_07395, partial [Chitinispirillaceae bacterium]|nr:hypothetical protein [Chitinispirillaceae bacterium]
VGTAGQLFEKALPVSFDFTSPRAWAFTIIAIHEYFRRFDGDRLVNHGRELLAGRLFSLYNSSRSLNHPWFEEKLDFCNAKLPHALILSGRWLQNGEMLTAGLESLKWLLSIQTSPKGCFHSISQQYTENGDEEFIQKPIEAYSVISACLEAYRTTQDKSWFNEARRVFEWFLGRNDVGLPLYDSKTGGCRDALHVDRVNRNEGAEASISFYLSLVELQSMENTLASFREPINT